MPIVRRRLAEEIALALQQKIVELDLQEGDPMPSHANLAEQLSISVPSLREGLQVLAVLGIVRIEHGRGTIVGRPSIASYTRSVDSTLLARSHDLDDSISVLVTVVCSLVDNLSGVRRHDPPLSAFISQLRDADSSNSASRALREFYAQLVLPLRRTFQADIIDLSLRLILGTLSMNEWTSSRVTEFADSLERLVGALHSGEQEEARALVREQGSLLRNLAPVGLRLACATGSIGGTFYSVGLDIARGLRDLSGNLLQVQPSAGGIENVRRLANQEVDVAFTQAHVARAAYVGQPPWDKPFDDLRVICRTHALDLWIVTAGWSGIDDLRSLRGKRVSLGTRGGETSRIAEGLLRAHGYDGSMSEQHYLSISQAADAVSRGEIDVLFYLTGGMGTALSHLAESHELRVLGIDASVLDEMQARDPTWSTSTISIGVGGERISTLRVETLLVCRASLPDERAAEILRAAELAGRTSDILEPARPERVDPLVVHPGAGRA